MDTSIIFSLVVVVASSAVHLFNFYKKKKKDINQELVLALKSIIGDDAGKAANSFKNIKKIYKNSHDINIALGNLYRQQGNIDKAINLHQSLVTNKYRTKEKRAEALSELGHDYILAGMYDKAEYIYNELSNYSNYKLLAYNSLISISDYQSDWDRAIYYSLSRNRIEDMEDKKSLINYYCEKVDIYLQQQNITNAVKTYKLATKIGNNHKRLSITGYTLDIKMKQYATAINKIENLLDEDHFYILSSVSDLYYCYNEISQTNKFIVKICSYIKNSKSLRIIRCIAKSLIDNLDGNELFNLFSKLAAENKHLDKRFASILKIYLESNKSQSEIIHGIMSTMDLVLTESDYRCFSCGLDAHIHYWQCPSCRQWDQIQLRN